MKNRSLTTIRVLILLVTLLVTTIFLRRLVFLKLWPNCKERYAKYCYRYAMSVYLPNTYIVVIAMKLPHRYIGTYNVSSMLVIQQLFTYLVLISVAAGKNLKAGFHIGSNFIFSPFYCLANITAFMLRKMAIRVTTFWLLINKNLRNYVLIIDVWSYEGALFVTSTKFPVVIKDKIRLNGTPC